MVTRRFLRFSLLGLLGFMVFCLVVMEVALHGKQWARLYNQLSPSHPARAFVIRDQAASFRSSSSSSFSFTEAFNPSTRAGQQQNLTVTALPDRPSITSTLNESSNTIAAAAAPTLGLERKSAPAAAAANALPSVPVAATGKKTGGSLPLPTHALLSILVPGNNSAAAAAGKEDDNATQLPLPPTTIKPQASLPEKPTAMEVPPSGSSAVDHCRGGEGRGGEGGGGPAVASASSGGTFSFGAQRLPDGSRPQTCDHCFYSRFPALLQSCQVCNAGAGGQGEGEVKVEVVMMILTTHAAAEKRQAIRRTWASITRSNSVTSPVRHVFVLGRSKDEQQMKQVRKEHQQHGDIIMYDFQDSYANLTLKTLTCLHWVSQYCHNARFMLKADDDMWINVPTLLSTVRRENTTLQTAIGGACYLSAGPIRDRNSKWYASVKDYPQNSYPGFCSGTSYVTSLNVVQQVLSVSPDVPFFYLEDVYMALCIKKLGPPFRLYRLGGFFHGWASPCVLKGPKAISVHEVAPSRLIYIWEAKCP